MNDDTQRAAAVLSREAETIVLDSTYNGTGLHHHAVTITYGIAEGMNDGQQQARTDALGEGAEHEPGNWIGEDGSRRSECNASIVMAGDRSPRAVVQESRGFGQVSPRSCIALRGPR